MNLTLTPKQLLSELPAFHAANLVPYVMSAPGIGKSSIFRQYAKSVGLPHVDTRLAYAAPTDVRGLPFLKNDAMTYAVPAEYPTEASVWTLEELPCAARTVQVAALQLTLERCIGDYCVPDGTLLSVTGNRAVDKAHVERMSSAVINRLVLVTLAPSIEDWTEWAFAAGVDPRIVAFLRFRPELLSQFDGAKWDGYSAFPSPRSWEMAARYVVASGGTSPHAPTILSGIVGQAAAMELHGFLQVFGRIPSIDGILLDPDGYQARRAVRHCRRTGGTHEREVFRSRLPVPRPDAQGFRGLHHQGREAEVPSHPAQSRVHPLVLQEHGCHRRLT
jgi:hypothetical protein